MPLSIIKGHDRIQNSEPDGDSIHFHPANPEAFTSLHLGAHLSGQGGSQLRLEAIDALETHYSPRVAGGFLQHQPLGLAPGRRRPAAAASSREPRTWRWTGSLGSRPTPPSGTSMQNENLSVDGIEGTQTWTTLLGHGLLCSQPG
jgi:hypothetical protein